MDYGIDDSMATLYLTSVEGIEIVAIGTVHSNTDAVSAAHNAAQVMRSVGRTAVPIAIGSLRPMAQEINLASEVHGEDGIGGQAAGGDSSAQITSEPAAMKLVRLARERPGQLTVLATGPLTNLAAAALLDPELPQLLHSVVIMGGAVRVAGNITPHAEANVWHDPEAADIVFSTFARVTLVPVDFTHAAWVDEPRLDAIEGATSTPLRDLVRAMLPQYRSFHLSVGDRVGFPLHDPSAAVLLCKPHLARYDEVELVVETRGELTRGAVLVDDRERPVSSGRPRVSVAVEAAASIADEFVSVAFGTSTLA